MDFFGNVQEFGLGRRIREFNVNVYGKRLTPFCSFERGVGMAATADVVIVGAGIIGLSAAYELARLDSSLNIHVLEREIMPGLGSTGKAGGGIRYQFSSRINIQLTQWSAPFYEQFQEVMGTDIGLRHHGYLFVTNDASRMESLIEGLDLQHEMGVPSRLLTVDEIVELFPVIHRDDLVGGTFCHLDASADPSAALLGYYKRVREMGVTVRFRSEVTGVRVENGRVKAVEVGGEIIETPMMINAAGPSAHHVARMVGVDLPMRPYRRQVFVASRPDALGPDWPLLVDLDTGWYVHPHRDSLLLGGTDRDTDPGENDGVNWEGLQRVVRAGALRVPILAEAEVVRGYVGFRSLTPDFHAILGPVPEVEGFLCANGWSGHGFMHAPAAGKLLAELVTLGEARSLDISPLSIERFSQSVHEEFNVF